MAVAVRRATSSDRSSWDIHVATCDQGTLAHTSAWLDAVREAYGGVLELLVAYEGDRVVGLLPVFVRRRMALRMVLSPPPKSLIEYLGPLVLQERESASRERERRTSAVLQAFVDHLAAEYRSDLVNMRASLPYGGPRVFSWSGYDVTPQFTFVMDLSRGTDQILAGFRRDARKAIRKAERIGLGFRASGKLEDALAVYATACARYRQQGLGPPYSETYLRALWARLAPNGMCALLLERDGMFLMGGILAVHNGTLAGLSGAPRTALDGVSLNDYFHLCTIRWAAEQGLTYYDLVGANTRSIAEYKSKLGGELKEYYRVGRQNMLGRLATSAYARFGR